MTKERKPMKVRIVQCSDTRNNSVNIDGHELANMTSTVQIDWPAHSIPIVRLEVFASDAMEVELNALVNVTVIHIYEGPR